MNFKKISYFIGLLCVSCFFTSITAETKYTPDNRSQLPALLSNSYIGFGAGYPDIPFSNKNLLNNYQANHFTYPKTGLNIYIGHYITPYLATEISLMRPIKWIYVNGIATPNDKHSIWISLFGINLKPTIPLSDQFSVYGLGGLGIVSRHGFMLNNSVVIPSTNLLTFLTGFGVNYAITPNWHVNLGLEYALARPNQQQPAILYSFVSMYYLLTPLQLPAYYTTQYLFPKNLIQIGAFSTEIFHPNINKYFTVGYLPVFWTGDVKTQHGEWIQYERNVFHTHQLFSLDLGVSISNYYSKLNHTDFQAFSVYPSIRVWMLRSLLADFYFTYSIAGPTWLTKQRIDNIDLGGHFTFQDLLGFGLFLGKTKNFNINLKIGHYSNGNLWPNNPGVEIPVVCSLGYAFE